MGNVEVFPTRDIQTYLFLPLEFVHACRLRSSGIDRGYSGTIQPDNERLQTSDSVEKVGLGYHGGKVGD